MNKGLKAIVARARLDRVSGASEIARRIANEVAHLLKNRTRIPSKVELERFALEIVRVQPNMAPVWNLANSILLSDLSPKAVRRVCVEAMAHHSSAPGRIGARLAVLIRDRVVVTNSSSTAVAQAFTHLPQRNKTRILVPESRPMREGAAFAKRLAKTGVDVTLFSDASLARAVSQADVAVVGVDAVTLRGVVGKVGLMHLALCAKECSIDCYACADSSKFAPLLYDSDNRSPREVLGKIPKGLKVENVYFEEAPHRLLTAIITESASVRPRQIAAHLSKIRVAPELNGR